MKKKPIKKVHLCVPVNGKKRQFAKFQTTRDGSVIIVPPRLPGYDNDFWGVKSANRDDTLLHQKISVHVTPRSKEHTMIKVTQIFKNAGEVNSTALTKAIKGGQGLMPILTVSLPLTRLKISTEKSKILPYDLSTNTVVWHLLLAKNQNNLKIPTPWSSNHYILFSLDDFLFVSFFDVFPAPSLPASRGFFMGTAPGSKNSVDGDWSKVPTDLVAVYLSVFSFECRFLLIKHFNELYNPGDGGLKYASILGIDDDQASENFDIKAIRERAMQTLGKDIYNPQIHSMKPKR